MVLTPRRLCAARAAVNFTGRIGRAAGGASVRDKNPGRFVRPEPRPRRRVPEGCGGGESPGADELSGPYHPAS